MSLNHAYLGSTAPKIPAEVLSLRIDNLTPNRSVITDASNNLISGGGNGDTGPKGDTGATGPKGDTGAKGDTGGVSTIQGTANQIILTGTSPIVLSTPQNIGTSSNVNFLNVTAKSSLNVSNTSATTVTVAIDRFTTVPEAILSYTNAGSANYSIGLHTGNNDLIVRNDASGTDMMYFRSSTSDINIPNSLSISSLTANKAVYTDGSKNLISSDGITGPKGDTGAAGVAGATGAKGDTGNNGTQLNGSWTIGNRTTAQSLTQGVPAPALCDSITNSGITRGSTGTYTANKTGIYAISGVLTTSTATGEALAMWVSINGGATIYGYTQTGTIGTGNSVNTCCLINMNAGDTFIVYVVSQKAGGSTTASLQASACLITAF